MVAIERGLGPVVARASQITITLLADKKVRMVATCQGKPDATYAASCENNLIWDLLKLFGELRRREAVLADESVSARLDSEWRRLDVAKRDRDFANGAQSAVPTLLQHTLRAPVEAGLTQEMMGFIIAVGELRSFLERVSVLLPETADSCKSVTGALTDLLIHLTPLSLQLVAALLGTSQRTGGSEGGSRDIK